LHQKKIPPSAHVSKNTKDERRELKIKIKNINQQTNLKKMKNRNKIREMQKIRERYIDELGWIIHPLDGKKPLIYKWNEPNTITLENCKKRIDPNGNIGLLCGSKNGIIVVDIDPLKESENKDLFADGSKIWNRLIEENGEPETVTSKTGKGKHYYFKYNKKTSLLRTGDKLGTTKSGKRITWDVKTDNENGTSTNIVLPPSIHPDTGKEYEWIRSPFDYEILEMPEWLYKILPQKESLKKKEKKIKSTKKEKKEEEKVEHGCYTKKDVEDRLLLLSDDRVELYDDWIKVGQLLKNCGIEIEDEEWAYELWNEWSTKSDNYDESIMEKKWNSFKRKWNYGTLCKLAKEDNEEEYFKLLSLAREFIITETIKTNIFRNQVGHADIIAEIYKNNIVCTDIKQGSGYKWDKYNKIWISYEEQQLLYLVCTTLEKIISDYHYELSNIKTDDEDEQNKNTLKKKQIEKILGGVRTKTHSKNVCELLRVLIFNDNFYQKLDSISYLLPIQNNQVVNLKTAECREREKNDYFTFECPVSIGLGKNLDKVEEFMKDLMGTEEKTRYLQTMSGFFLTGEKSDRQLFLSYGLGSNAKSEYINLMRKILGKYYSAVSKEVFIKDRKTDRHVGAPTPYLIPLIGKRLCTFSETSEKDKLNISLLKSLTGGDAIQARELRKEEKTIDPFCKLMLLTNFRPEWNIKDQAFVDRLRYLPFESRFVDKPRAPNERLKDKKKAEKITAEYLDDVFLWMLQGSQKYYKEGLIVPESLEEKKQEYIAEQDILQDFLEQHIKENKNNKIKITTLSESFNQWARRNDYDDSYNPRKLCEILRDKGYKVELINKTQHLIDYILNFED
jgi:P4 family phage/plasmid primase-like protien